MLIVRSQSLTRSAEARPDEEKDFVVAYNLDNCEGLSVFNCVACVLINGRNEMIARFKTHEEAMAMIDEIIEAMRSGATVYDCNKRR